LISPSLYAPVTSVKSVPELEIEPDELETMKAFMVLNWQTGAASVHSISAGMGLGTWTIIGVRAHEDETDHIGGYVTVSTAVNILADGFR
jgi:hypothetical protein